MNALIRKEKCLLITAILISFSSWGRADSVVLKDGRNFNAQEIDSSTDTYTLQYSLVTVHYSRHPVTQIALDKPAPKKDLPDIFMSSVVEASISPKNEVIRSALAAHNTIKQASSLKELETVLGPVAFQDLKTRISAGAPEITTIELLQNFIPNTVEVTDIHFENEVARVAVTGENRNRHYAGIIEMVREGGVWKLENETWYSDDGTKNSVKHSIKYADLTRSSKSDLSERSPSWHDPYFPDRANPLGLEKANMHMPKDSFFLFYFLNGKTKKQTARFKHIEEPDVHLIWSASFKTLEQQNLPGRYPLDMTIAQERDGYMPNKVNLRLPKSKPNKFFVGVLYSF